MNADTYSQNPALRPTVLAHEVLKNVYRPNARALPASGAASTEGEIEDAIARETPRAA